MNMNELEKLRTPSTGTQEKHKIINDELIDELVYTNKIINDESIDELVYTTKL